MYQAVAHFHGPRRVARILSMARSGPNCDRDQGFKSELHPARGMNGQRRATFDLGLERVQPHQRQAQFAVAGAKGADFDAVPWSPACPEAGRAWPPGHGHQPPLQQAAIFRPGGQFLPHVTALGPGYAAQFVEPGLQQHRLLRLHIPAAIRQTEAQPVAVIGIGVRGGLQSRSPARASPLQAGGDRARPGPSTSGTPSQAA